MPQSPKLSSVNLVTKLLVLILIGLQLLCGIFFLCKQCVQGIQLFLQLNQSLTK